MKNVFLTSIFLLLVICATAQTPNWGTLQTGGNDNANFFTFGIPDENNINLDDYIGVFVTDINGTLRLVGQDKLSSSRTASLFGGLNFGVNVNGSHGSLGHYIFKI